MRSKETIPGPSVTVLFAFDSAALDHRAKARLSSFIESVGPRTKGIDLRVAGYTCDLGNKLHNDVLARQRAEAVVAHLRKTGLRPVEVTGRGKCCYSTQDPHKRYLNRRVEVITGKKEGTQ